MNYFRKSARPFSDGPPLICQGVRIFPIPRHPAEKDGKLMGPPVLNVKPDQKLPSLMTANRGRSVPKAQIDRMRMRAPPTGPSVTGLDASKVSLPLVDCIPPSNNIRKPEQKFISHVRVIRGEKIQYESFSSHVPPTGSSPIVSLPLFDCFSPSNIIRMPEQKFISHVRVIRGEKIQYESFRSHVPPNGSSPISVSKMSLPLFDCFSPSNIIRTPEQKLTSNTRIIRGEKIQHEPFLTRVPPAGSSLIGASKTEKDGKLMGPPVLNVKPDQKLPSLTTANRGRSVPKAQFDRKRMRAPPAGPSATGLDASKVSPPLLDCVPPYNNIRKPEQQFISHVRVIRGEKIQYESFRSHVPPTGSSPISVSKMSLPLFDCFSPSNIIRTPEQKLTSNTRIIRGENMQYEPFLTRVPPAGSSLIEAPKMSLPLLGRFPPSRPLQPLPPMSMKRTFSTEHSDKHLDLLEKNSTEFSRLNP
nr:uncharacterized protein LOC129427790 isoform X3 [Misgurnus anguillicaudatus]